MADKIEKAVKIARCLDKLFDNLHEEKLIDGEVIQCIKSTKDSIKRAVKAAQEEPDASDKSTQQDCDRDPNLHANQDPALYPDDSIRGC